MKKLIPILLLISLVLSIAACTANDNKSSSIDQENTEEIMFELKENELIFEVVSYDDKDLILKASELGNTGVTDYIISVKNDNNIDLSQFVTGDKIAVQFDAIIESYPAQVMANNVKAATQEQIEYSMDSVQNNLISNSVRYKEVSYSNLPDSIKEEIDKNHIDKDHNLIESDSVQYLVVYMGEQSTGGYSIKIEEIQKVEDSYIVTVNEKIPGRNQMVTESLTYPKNIVIIINAEGLTEDNLSIERYEIAPSEEEDNLL